MPDQWMSIVEYARTFSISDMTIRRRIKSGKIHAVLREGKYYIPVKMTEDGKYIPQRKSPFSLDADEETDNLEHQTLPRVIPQQINVTPNKNIISVPIQSHSMAQTNLHKIAAGGRGFAPEASGNLGTQNDQNSLPRPPMISSQAIHPSSSYSTAPKTPGVTEKSELTELSTEVRNLMHLTRDMLTRLDRDKAYYKGEFEQKILTQQEQIKNRDSEVQNLKQKIEDMQLLIKIMESKQSAQES